MSGNGEHDMLGENKLMEFRDQRGHIIRFQDYPQRIISLVPSLTELLFDLGLDEEIQRAFEALPVYPPLRAAYLIWVDPYMAAGGEIFIDHILGRCGFVNVFGERPRYPEVTLEEVGEADVILLSSEPYDFDREDVETPRRECSGALVGPCSPSMGAA